MATATMWAARSLCSRLKVGAVITSSDMRRILAIGYNGPAKGLPQDRCKASIPGACGCLHAEDNAIAAVDSTIPNKILFVTHQPCEQCAQRVMQANIAKVFYSLTYRSDAGAALLSSVGIPTVCLPSSPLIALAARVAQDDFKVSGPPKADVCQSPWCGTREPPPPPH
jgi:dCMP deaminase